MKVTVVGSHLCPDTLYALCQLRGKDIDIDFKNLSASLPDLKEYLALRDGLEIYNSVKAEGGIGIPCFILEDGSKTLDLNEVLAK
ncbi:glutaredoxin [Romboutsia sedimentorum]|uniref:glutaredoxin n=1 Tax=Romboutsia sedimentorum TaxID=1368474 RepID=UPI0024DEA3DF|nr:glutaredoxin [Romboutsia sedimentorum]MDK2586072.1 glutaredoxin [Romboutsia sedimentorum]